MAADPDSVASKIHAQALDEWREFFSLLSQAAAQDIVPDYVCNYLARGQDKGQLTCHVRS